MAPISGAELGIMSDLRDQWAAAVLADRELGEARVTGWAIREYADRLGRATMGNSALARDTSQNRATVERHIAKLKKRGYLGRIEGGGVRGRGGFTALTELRIPGRGTRSVAGTLNGQVPAQVPAIVARSTRTVMRDEPQETIEPTRGRAREAGLARPRAHDERRESWQAARALFRDAAYSSETIAKTFALPLAEVVAERERFDARHAGRVGPLSADAVIETLEDATAAAAAMGTRGAS